MFSAYTLTMFIWHYVVPPTFFTFAYYKIIRVIRDQQRVVGPTAPPRATTSVHTEETHAGDGQEKQKSKVNVVRTMSAIVICFCICYLPYNVYDKLEKKLHLINFIYVYDTSPPLSCNLISNPFISCLHLLAIQLATI